MEDKSLIYFILDDINKFHKTLEEVFTVSSGVRHQSLLESAVSAPFQTWGGVELYPSVYEKAAQLCFALSKNHPFVDGNKRTAIHTMLVYLAVNDLEIRYDIDDMEEVILQLTTDTITTTDLAAWLEERARKFNINFYKEENLAD
ncbi:MAG: type II toxin-antitoxin system death-on-curing family toxin [Veillonella sp.]|nr:type II toxin-antitoxin system death-on-curing family toxin [Veillonella sp.]